MGDMVSSFTQNYIIMPWNNTTNIYEKRQCVSNKSNGYHDRKIQSIQKLTLNENGIIQYRTSQKNRLFHSKGNYN